MGNCLCAKAVEEEAQTVEPKVVREHIVAPRNSQRGTSRTNSRNSTGPLAPVIVQPAGELLESAREGLSYGQGTFRHVDPETLCALALAASAGIETLEAWCDDIAEMRLGVCQMTLSAAQSLAANHGCTAFGAPTKQTLLSAASAMYFAAAMIEELSTFGGIQRSVYFCVRAFFAGPKLVSEEEEEEWPQAQLTPEQLADKSPQARLALLWHNFKIARRHVSRLQSLEAQADAEMSPMHVVQKDETLASIAKACQVTGQELHSINPDMPSSLQCGDCIALPKTCQPRLYCTRRGDSWAAIAGFLHTPPGKLRLHNADAVVVRHGSSILASLTNSSILLEGQLIEAPGLGNGSSECSDESRMEDPAADFLLTSGQLHGFGQLRPSSMIIGHFEPPIELQNTTSKEIVDATLE